MGIVCLQVVLFLVFHHVRELFFLKAALIAVLWALDVVLGAVRSVISIRLKCWQGRTV